VGWWCRRRAQPPQRWRGQAHELYRGGRHSKEHGTWFEPTDDPLSTCVTCGACDETTFHALLECTYAHQFWIRMRELTGIKLPVLSPASWSAALLDDRICDEHKRAIILCGMWSLWHSGNDHLHGKSPIDMRAAINWAIDVCFNLMSVKGTEKGVRGHWRCSGGSHLQ
jgi:hypothetical protein